MITYNKANSQGNVLGYNSTFDQSGWIGGSSINIFTGVIGPGYTYSQLWQMVGGQDGAVLSGQVNVYGSFGSSPDASSLEYSMLESSNIIDFTNLDILEDSIGAITIFFNIVFENESSFIATSAPLAYGGIKSTNNGYGGAGLPPDGIFNLELILNLGATANCAFIGSNVIFLQN
jgi:hypothetical protein